MIYENEIIMCVLGLGVLVFVLANYGHLKQIRSFGVLLVGFCLLLVAWILTVVEGFFWYKYLNFAEHMCYAISAIVTVFWLWDAFGRVKEDR